MEKKYKPAKCNLLCRNEPRGGNSIFTEGSTPGKVVGPLPLGSILRVQVSLLRVIPKGHTPGRWRLIVDLCSSDRNSVNDCMYHFAWADQRENQGYI